MTTLLSTSAADALAAPGGLVDGSRADRVGDTTRLRLGGVRFDNVNLDEAVAWIERPLQMKRAALVITANVDHVVRAQRDRRYAAVLRRADMVVADGQPLVWLSRMVGAPLKQRVAGSDLFPRLCGRAAAAGWRVFFLGGDPGAAEAARDVLQERYPQLRVVGTYCPPHGFERDRVENERVLQAVRAAQPDLVFVGLGSPKQERWIFKHMHAYGPAVSIGIGISFSFQAGQVKRAPAWMQQAGLEWLHRLLQEPGRLWRRYLSNLLALPVIMGRDLLRARVLRREVREWA